MTVGTSTEEMMIVSILLCILIKIGGLMIGEMDTETEVDTDQEVDMGLDLTDRATEETENMEIDILTMTIEIDSRTHHMGKMTDTEEEVEMIMEKETTPMIIGEIGTTPLPIIKRRYLLTKTIKIGN